MKTYPESRLTDLLIEFDEMGFCPTTVCPNPEQTAIEWKEQIVKEIQKLQAENTELRERLGGAIELPCKLGSPLYVIDETRDTDTWELKPCVTNKYYAAEVTVCENGDFLFQVETSTSHKRLRFGEDIFTTRAEAEARLKELKEEI